MATLYIEEFATVAEATNLTGPSLTTAQAAKFPSIAGQTITITGVSAQSAAFSTTTTLVRVETDAVCSILIGNNPTAVTTRMRMQVGQTEYFGVRPGDKIAAITNT